MSLTSLPTELIEQIATYLDLASARSQRLVCSSLRQQTIHIFKGLFFCSHSLKWTKEGLDRLRDVSAHKDLGDALKHLIIDATPRDSILLWQLREHLSDGGNPFVADHLVQALHLDVVESKYAAVKKEAEVNATFFNETRYDVKTLLVVFKKLSQLNSIVFEYEGFARKYSTFARRYCESSQHEMSRPFVSTIAAIAATNIHIDKISIHSSRNHGAVSIGRLESLAPSLRNLEGPLETLQVLVLNLRDWRRTDSGFELDTYRAPFIVRLLAKARNIRELSLSCYSSLEPNLFGEMARHCRFDKLESCHLFQIRVYDAPDLINFFAPSASTLKSLSLTHVILLDEDSSWNELLNEIASSPDILVVLETLELVNLAALTGLRMVFEESWSLMQCVEGWGEEAGSKDWRVSLSRALQELREGETSSAWHAAAVACPFN